jgi:hypothetical protein
VDVDIVGDGLMEPILDFGSSDRHASQMPSSGK